MQRRCSVQIGVQSWLAPLQFCASSDDVRLRCQRCSSPAGPAPQPQVDKAEETYRSASSMKASSTAELTAEHGAANETLGTLHEVVDMIRLRLGNESGAAGEVRARVAAVPPPFRQGSSKEEMGTDVGKQRTTACLESKIDCASLSLFEPPCPT